MSAQESLAAVDIVGVSEAAVFTAMVWVAQDLPQL